MVSQPYIMISTFQQQQQRQQQQHRYWIPSSVEMTPPALSTITRKEKSIRKKRSLEGKSDPTKRVRSSTNGTNSILPSPKTPVNQEEVDRRAQRKARFQNDNDKIKAMELKKKDSRAHTVVEPLYQPLSSPRSANDDDKTATSETIIGTNQALEKPYLRLTTFPDPKDVRPLPILIKALAHVKAKYIKNEDFEWANEQLKSLRQDLTVQNIRNSFVLEVYETHARILLENGDLNEFNQCQSMIRSLTMASNEDDSIPSAASHPPLLRQSKDAADEFSGYALLYALVRNSWMELNLALGRPQELAKKPLHPQAKKKLEKATTSTESAQSTTAAFGCLYPQKSTADDRMHHCYEHALSVVRAVVDEDYRTFFKLYDSAPHMSCYLMDFLVKRVRESCYVRTIASYRPNVGVEQFREWLCMRDLEETRQFLKQQGAVFWREDHVVGAPNTAAFWVDCKKSYAVRQRDSNARSMTRSSSAEEDDGSDGDDADRFAAE